MKFYKAVKEVQDYKTFYETVLGELITEKERAKKFPTLSDKCFQAVEVSKNATYWLFGARFPMTTN